MSKEQENKKGKKKIDKTRLAIKIVAGFLALTFIATVFISAIFAIINY